MNKNHYYVKTLDNTLTFDRLRIKLSYRHPKTEWKREG